MLLRGRNSSPSRHGFSTRDSTHHRPPPHPQESVPQRGCLGACVSTLGCCPVNAGGVLGGEMSFLRLPLLSVALTEQAITKFRHHQSPHCAFFSFPAQFTQQMSAHPSRPVSRPRFPRNSPPPVHLPNPSAPPSRSALPSLLRETRSSGNIRL